MNLEEIQIRLGLDASQLSTGLRGAQSGVENFGEHAHKSFLHAGSAGKSFHKILEQITEQSPLLGNALRFALSPVVGVFAAALYIFKTVKGELEDMEKLFDKIGDIMAEPIGSAKRAAEAGKEAVSIMKQEQAAFLLATEKGELPIVKALNEQLKLLQEQFKVRAAIVKKQEELGDITKQQADKKKTDLEKQQAEAEFHAKGKALLDVSAARVKASVELESAEREQNDERRAALLSPEGAKKTIADLEAAQERIKAARIAIAERVNNAREFVGKPWAEMTPGERLSAMSKKAMGEGVDIIAQDEGLRATQERMKAEIEHTKEVARRASLQERFAKVRLKAAQEDYAQKTQAFGKLSDETEDARIKAGILQGPHYSKHDKFLLDLVNRYGPRSIPDTDLKRLQKLQQGVTPQGQNQETLLSTLVSELQKLNARAEGGSGGVIISPTMSP